MFSDEDAELSHIESMAETAAYERQKYEEEVLIKEIRKQLKKLKQLFNDAD
jgi:hypothetical protein